MVRVVGSASRSGSALAGEPLLEVSGVAVHFGGVRAVDGVDLQLDAGGRIGIIGPNGAGKTTLINAIAGEVRPTAGHIHLGGVDITPFASWDVARRGIAQTFQSTELFKTMTVERNLRVSIDTGGFRARRARASADEVALLIDEVLAMVELDDLRGDVVGFLPYGRQRVVELARAVVRRPVVLLLDEPAAGLASSEKVAFVKILDRVIDNFGFALLMIEHDMTTLKAACGEHVYVMDAGKVIAEGTFEKVASDPRVMSAYLGIETEGTTGEGS